MTSKNLSSQKRRLEDIEKELKQLGQFKQTKALQQFRRQLLGELSHLKRQMQLQKPRKETARERQRRRSLANESRSKKMKRSWRYFKALKQNYYPDKSLREIRSSFKKHRNGLETDVSEVAWRNPSP